MKTTISVIVPIYKVEPYIHKCLDSIVAQTVTPYEVILVNDGTPDRSGEIAKSYAEKYPFLKYIEQQNGGPSKARNVGMEHATGEYITFLDPDDFWSRDAYEEMVALVEYGEADLYLFDFLKTNEKGEVIDDVVSVKPGTIERYGREVLERRTFFRGYMGWYQIYKRTRLIDEGLTFPEGIAHIEDSIFVARYLKGVYSLLHLHKPLYFYRQRESSITHIGHKRKKAGEFLTGIYILLDDWKDEGAKTPMCVRKHAMSFGLKQYYKVYLKMDDLQLGESKEVKREIRKYIYTADSYGIELPFRRKMLLVARFFPLFRLYYRWQDKRRRAKQ